MPKVKTQLSRSQEILNDLRQLSHKCRLAVPDDEYLMWLAEEVRKDEGAGLMGEAGWPSGGKKGGKECL